MARSSFDDDDDLDDMINEVLQSDRHDKPVKTKDSIKKSLEFLDEKAKVPEEAEKHSLGLFTDPLSKSSRSDIDFPARERETVPSLMSTAPPVPVAASAAKRSTPKKSLFDDDDDPLDLLEGGPSRSKSKQQKSPQPQQTPAASGSQQASRTNFDWLFAGGPASGANSNAGSASNLHADSMGEQSRPGSASKRRPEAPELSANDADGGGSFLSNYVPSGMKHTGGAAAAAPVDFSASFGFEKKTTSIDSPARQRPDVEKLDVRKPQVEIVMDSKPLATAAGGSSSGSGLFDIFGGADVAGGQSPGLALGDSRRTVSQSEIDFEAKPAKESGSKLDFDSLFADPTAAQRGNASPAAGAGKPPAVATTVSRKNSVSKDLKDPPKLVAVERDLTPDQERLRVENRQLATQNEALRRQTDAEIRTLKELHAGELEQLRKAHEATLALLKKQLADREQLMQERERIFAEQLKDREQMFSEEMKRLRYERDEQRKRFDERVAELEQQRAAAVERERAARSTFEKDLELANRSLGDSLSRLVDASLNEMKRAFAEHDLARVTEQLSRNTNELARLASRSAETDRVVELNEKEARLRKLETQLAERARELDEAEMRARKLSERQLSERETETARISEERVRIVAERQLLERAKETFDNERRAAERQLDAATKDLERARSDVKVEVTNERAALNQLRETLQSERLRFENERASFADLRNQELLKLTEQRNSELGRLKQIELELRSRTDMLKNDEEKLKTFQTALAQKEKEMLDELQRLEAMQKVVKSHENELERHEKQFEARNEQLEKSRKDLALQKQQAAAEFEEVRRAKLEQETRADSLRRLEQELKVSEKKLVEERVFIEAQLRELESKRNSFVCQACRQPVRDMINQHVVGDVRSSSVFADEQYSKYAPREAAGLDAISNARQLRMRLDNDAAMRNFLYEAEQDQRFLEEERVFLAGISGIRHPNY